MATRMVTCQKKMKTVFDDLARFDPGLGLQERCVHQWRCVAENAFRVQFKCEICSRHKVIYPTLGQKEADLPIIGDGRNEERYGSVEALSRLLDRLVPIFHRREADLLHWFLYDCGPRPLRNCPPEPRMVSASLTMVVRDVRKEFHKNSYRQSLRECFAEVIADAVRAVMAQNEAA